MRTGSFVVALALLTATAPVASSFLAGHAIAAPCRDTQGKFTKCPPKPTKCRDAKGRYTKCGTDSATPS